MLYFFTTNTYTSHIFFAVKRCFTCHTYTHKLVKTSLFFVLLLINYQIFSQNPITGNQGFQVITEGNFTSTGSHHIHGPLAVGGNLVINSSVGEINMDATGSYVFPGDGSTTTGLLVKGSITWSAGLLRVLNNKYIHIGNSNGSLSGDNGTNSATQVYPTGTAYNNAKRIETTIDQTPSPAVFQTVGFDFTTLFSTYRTNSTNLSTSTNNVQLYNSNNVAFSGNNVTSSQQVRINALTTGVNYLNLTPASLTNISDLTFNDAPSATKILVINVPITANYTWNNANMSGIGGSAQGPYIIWNFYGTTTYNITIAQATLIVGTVYAPNMNIIKTGTGDIDGNLIAKTAQLSLGEIHNYQFDAVICSNVTAGGTVGSNQSFCISGNPAAFTSSVAASGGSGTIQYQWEKSIDDGITWVDIVGATSATYDEPNTISITTQYRRKAKNSTCTTYGATSNAIIVTVVPINAATASSDSPITAGGTINLTSTGGGTYAWSGPSSFVSTLQNPSRTSATTAMAGVYTVTVTNSGCTSTATTSVTILSNNNLGIDCSLIPTLSFTNPTLISGTAGADNAQYRFSNVTGGTDAIVTILSRTHSDITVVDLDIPASTYGGYDAAMQPIIDYNWINSNGTFDASGERSVTFKIDFVASGTSTPKVIPSVVVTGLDIDGSGTEVREFIQSSGFQSHGVQNPTSLTLSGSLKAKGSLTTYTGINEQALDAMISYAYMNTSSITITYGADWNGSTSGFADNANPTMSDERRLNSLYFKCYDLNNNTCDLVLTPPTPNAGNRCGTGTVTLSASGCTGTYTWYNVSTGGTSIGTGSSFITPSISSSTTYYVECTAVGCTSSRASVIATVYTIPSAPTVTGGSNCGTGMVTLSVSGCTGGTVQWYSSQTGTTLLASGTNFSVASLANSTVYFVACTNSDGCVSTTRNYGVATINPIPQAELSSVNPTCLGMQSVSNGKLLLNKFEGSDLFSYNVGSTYNTGSATAFTSIPTNGELLTGISDPVTSISYTVRIKNPENCTIDRTITIVKQCNVCPVSYCEPPTNIVKTK